MSSVGVIGGGQLARMMIPFAVNLDIELKVLAEAEHAPAGLAATAVGDYRDLDTVMAFAKTVDVVTFDHEHVPQRVLRALVDAGVTVRPSPDALRYAQDKLAMRRRLSELGLPVPDWAAVSTEDAVAEFLADHGGRAVLKTPRGGYDGHGVKFLTDAAEATEWLDDEFLHEFPDGLLIEESITFKRELAQLCARRPSGELQLWPLVETVQRDGVCSEVFAPAPGATTRMQAVSTSIAETVANELDVTGVLAVELFETTDERILVNELAMRPHNSGHWTMDGATTGQFEQHLRAVLDLPLGSPSMLAPIAVMVNVLGGPTAAELPDCRERALASEPAAKLHWYGKTYRPGRKVGHVNLIGLDLDDVVFRATEVAKLMQG